MKFVGKNIQFVLAVLAISLSVAAFYQRHSAEGTIAQYERQSSDFLLLEDKLDDLNRRLAHLEENPLFLIDDATGIAEVDLMKVENRLDDLEHNTLGLRQAFNPISPDEVLTIARLHDEIGNIRAELSRTRESIVSQNSSFQDSVERELASYRSLSNIVIAAIITLALNVLYTMAKNYVKQTD